MPGERAGISRREFAGRAAAAAATAAIPAGVLGMAEAAASTREMPPAPPQEPRGGATRLSAEGRAEVEAKVGEILRRYGAQIDEAQKADVRRLVGEAQAQIEALRAFRLENSDEPAAVFHLVKTAPRGLGTARPASAAPAAAKNPANGDA